MNVLVQEWIVDNGSWSGARPRMSVLIPFLNEDPRRLIAVLDGEAARLGGLVELVLLDDGAGDDDLAHQVADAVQTLNVPARLVQLFANEGRSRGRNRLARHSRAEHLLFLDSDTLPDAPDFLERYLQLIGRERPAVAFGGFSLAQVDPWPEHRLHCKLAERFDCAPASVRRRRPAKFVFSSNVLVRRDVFEAEPFDEDFVGWGWEDVEWGVRVDRVYPITHVDNPATHLGLDTPRMIALKYEDYAGNFGKILEAHPTAIKRHATYRLALLLKFTPLARVWRGALKAIALSEPAPLALRAFCMRLYRVAVSADAI
jgi:glycosyltransferase involved in cell wall biosynthesis